MREVLFDGTFTDWRRAARAALASAWMPGDVRWRASNDAQDSLFCVATPSPWSGVVLEAAAAVPRAFVALAADAACHLDATRWDTLYRVLWRLTHGERHLLEVYVDDDVHRLMQMAKVVRREGHKLRAFVRFRLVGSGSAHERYVAWFEPEQDVLAREAPFFARRFPEMSWSILTPDACAHWNGVALAFSPGVSRTDAPSGDELEELWRTYYASTFNPARTKPRMMRSEMPVRYWKHLPEASLIAPLLRDAPGRVQRMIAEAGSDNVGARPARMDTARMSTAAPVLDADIIAARERSDRARELLASHACAPGASPVGGCAVRVGTASWTDPTMTARGVFYPDDARSASARLAYYASRFRFVEVDATYYSLPSYRNAQLWAERTPDGFTFDIKAHALMTGHATEVARLPSDLREALPWHLRRARMVRTRDVPREIVDDVWRRFLSALEPLREANKLGALLLQMPRDFLPTEESERVIASFRERVGADALCAVEFRHASWVDGDVRRERTLELLREHDLAFVMVDAPPGFQSSMPRVVAVTSDKLAVLRMHGRRTETWEQPVAVTSERYRYLYDTDELRGWVPDIIDVAQQTQGVHVVMNNCHANYGAANADEITALIVEYDEMRRRSANCHPERSEGSARPAPAVQQPIRGNTGRA